MPDGFIELPIIDADHGLYWMTIARAIIYAVYAEDADGTTMIDLANGTTINVMLSYDQMLKLVTPDQQARRKFHA